MLVRITLLLPDSETLPPPGSGSAFERSHNFTGDPPPVKITFLCLYPFIAYVASAHLRRIKCQVVFEGGVAGHRIGVEPSSIRYSLTIYVQIVVTGHALKLAERTVAILLQTLHPNIARWQIVHRWMTGFQDALGAIRIGDDYVIKHNTDVFTYLFQAGRTGIVPHGLLSGLGFDSFHESKTPGPEGWFF